MNKTIGILHLEDSFRDSELIHTLIESGEIGHDYFLADNKKDFINILKTENIDIILSDYSLPDYNGNEALQVSREKYSHIPFIFVSGTIGEDAAIDALLNGATDYVLKHKLERLIPAIKRALNEHELEIKRKNAEAELIIANKELIFQNREKEKRAAELIIANKELVFQNREKEKRASELIIANKELVFQNQEKEKRAAELIIAKEKAEESDRLKSAFLTNMSHEIRTPMNGILGFAELLREPNLTGDDQQKYIHIIEDSGNRMLNIIDNIICISKIESKQSEISISETNINEQIKSIYSNFKTEVEQKGIEIYIKNSLPDEKAMILSDPKIINTIITNLLINAIKFTNKGQIYFGYIKKGKFLEFFVKDTGVGICQEQQKIIFERFRQASESLSRAYEGAGLGLSISKAYVEMLGGKIWVKSNSRVSAREKGSTFYFTLPYVTDRKKKSLMVE